MLKTKTKSDRKETEQVQQCRSASQGDSSSGSRIEGIVAQREEQLKLSMPPPAAAARSD